jgi:hypothetical protein
MASSPGDMEVLAIEKNWKLASHSIFICSKAFKKVAEGSPCPSYDVSNREQMRELFQGLISYE